MSTLYLVELEFKYKQFQRDKGLSMRCFPIFEFYNISKWFCDSKFSFFSSRENMNYVYIIQSVSSKPD